MLVAEDGLQHGSGGGTRISDVPKAVMDRLEKMLQWCWWEGGRRPGMTL